MGTVGRQRFTCSAVLLRACVLATAINIEITISRIMIPTVFLLLLFTLPVATVAVWVRAQYRDSHNNNNNNNNNKCNIQFYNIVGGVGARERSVRACACTFLFVIIIIIINALSSVIVIRFFLYSLLVSRFVLSSVNSFFVRSYYFLLLVSFDFFEAVSEMIACQ